MDPIELNLLLILIALELYFMLSSHTRLSKAYFSFFEIMHMNTSFLVDNLSSNHYH